MTTDPSQPGTPSQGSKCGITVRTDPVMEAIARKLGGYGSVPIMEQAKMIKRAAKAGRDAVAAENHKLREAVAAIHASAEYSLRPNTDTLKSRYVGTLGAIVEECERALPELKEAK